MNPSYVLGQLVYAWVTLRCLRGQALGTQMIAQMFPVVEQYRVAAASIVFNPVQPWLPAEVNGKCPPAERFESAIDGWTRRQR